MNAAPLRIALREGTPDAMRRTRAAAASAVTVSLLAAATACGGGSSTEGGSNDSPKTLTYWASNQGPSIEVDKKILSPS